MHILTGRVVGQAHTPTGDFQTIIPWKVGRDSTPEQVTVEIITLAGLNVD